VLYRRFGGLAPALTGRAATLDSELSPAEAAEARRLLPPGFYELEPSPPPSRGDDAFRYEIGVEDGSRAHRVILHEEDVPAGLRPFLAWLEERAAGR
jgi:hypothetical protein